MSINKTIATARRTKQFQALIDANFSLVSTDRQLNNGTLVFQAKIGKGKKARLAEYAVTNSGAVISNKFVARRVDGDGDINTYREGLSAIADLINKRLA